MEVSPAGKTGMAIGAGAAVGATALGAREIVKQRNILNNADEFVTKVTADAAKQKRFSSPFFAGTKEASELACKKIDEAAQKAIDFAKGGKMNLKQIGKKGAIGAAVGAAVVAGAVLLKKALPAVTAGSMKLQKDIITDTKVQDAAVELGAANKDLERKIVTNPETAQAIKDISDATGAMPVQNV